MTGFYGCGGSAPSGASDQRESAKTETEKAEQKPAESVPSTEGGISAAAEIPDSLVFAADENGQYTEPVLGSWEGFLKKVFKSYESGEVDPGSGITKYFGEGNDGYGYCFLVTTRSDQGSIVSYNIDTAIVSTAPNSGGDEVSGKTMVQWIYENFGK